MAETGVPAARNGSFTEALTFDDVLLKPGLSEVLPADADIRTRVTRGIELNIPIIASAMDTVTEAKMAIAMAQAGGIGVIHRNMEPEQQAAEVRQVKRFESGMVVNPVTIHPEATIGMLMAISRVMRLRTSTSEGSTSDRPGLSSTSSKVSASRGEPFRAICQLPSRRSGAIFK